MRISRVMRVAARTSLCGALLACGGLVSGCQTVEGQIYWPWQRPRVVRARQELAMQQVQQDAATARSQVEAMAQTQRELVLRLDRLEASTRDNAKMRDEIAALRREVEQLRNDRETMRKEIVDDLTTRINKYMATVSGGTPARSPGVKQAGYTHKVVAGQTLTDIAKAYKTTSSAIMKANNLKDSRLRAGQTLFIPEP